MKRLAGLSRDSAASIHEMMSDVGMPPPNHANAAMGVKFQDIRQP